MFEEIELGSEFFEGLLAIDAEITARVAAEGCRFCGGRLHRGDYDRKPRGGAVAAAAEAFRRRFSLCCGREGCRRRSMPPSVRFLGRRVYVGAVVIVATVVALAMATASSARRATGIPARTLRRWLRWWRGPFVATPVFVDVAARVPGVDRRRVPASILEVMLAGPIGRLRGLLAWRERSLLVQDDRAMVLRRARRARSDRRPRAQGAEPRRLTAERLLGSCGGDHAPAP
jgi:hypothetical protein